MNRRWMPNSTSASAAICACASEGCCDVLKDAGVARVGSGVHVILEEQGEIVAHVGIVDRSMTVGGSTFASRGVQNVFVMPAYRGTRLSDRVMKAAMDEAERRGYDFGLLFCIENSLRCTSDAAGGRCAAAGPC